MTLNARSVLIKPGVAIVMPIDQPSSILNVSKNLIIAALLAWYHSTNHNFKTIIYICVHFNKIYICVLEFKNVFIEYAIWLLYYWFWIIDTKMEFLVKSFWLNNWFYIIDTESWNWKPPTSWSNHYDPAFTIFKMWDCI